MRAEYHNNYHAVYCVNTGAREIRRSWMKNEKGKGCCKLACPNSGLNKPNGLACSM